MNLIDNFFKCLLSHIYLCLFSDRLKIQSGEQLDLIPHLLLRKYIAYAKQYVKPHLNEEACEILINFYIKLRQNHQNSESTPITPRQLESLIRFTEVI